MGQAVDLDDHDARPPRSVDIVAAPDEAADEHRVVGVVRIDRDEPRQDRRERGKDERGNHCVEWRSEVDVGHDRDDGEDHEHLPDQRDEQHQPDRERRHEGQQQGPDEDAQGANGDDRSGQRERRVDAYAG